MRLFKHPIIKHPALALLMIFCLPAQSLAAVLIQCEQHLSESAAVQTTSFNETSQHPESVPDCHGSASNVNNNQDPKNQHAASTEAAGKMFVAQTDANGCFHCSGACQNLKSPSLANTAEQSQLFDNSAFSRLALNTATGTLSTPARPPCPAIPS